jgi:hypothetical protein
LMSSARALQWGAGQAVYVITGLPKYPSRGDVQVDEFAYL